MHSTQDSLPHSLASVAGGLLLMRDILNTKTYYQSAMKPRVIDSFWVRARAIVEVHVGAAAFERLPECPLVRDVIDSGTMTESSLLESAADFLTRLHEQLPQFSDGRREGFFETCRSLQSPELNALVDEFAAECVRKCILARPLGMNSEPEEHAAAVLICLLEYLLVLVSIATQAFIRDTPHPATAVAVAINVRIMAILTRYPSLVSKVDRKCVEWVGKILETGAFDELSVDDVQIERVQKVAVVIEKLNARWSATPPSLTAAETIFFRFADIDITQFRKSVTERNRRFTEAVTEFAHQRSTGSRPDEPPRELLDRLTPQQQNILTYLWNAKHSTDWWSLPENCWRPNRERTPRAIGAALERLQKRLNEYCQYGVTLEISSKGERVKLIRDDNRK